MKKSSSRSKSRSKKSSSRKNSSRRKYISRRESSSNRKKNIVLKINDKSTADKKYNIKLDFKSKSKTKTKCYCGNSDELPSPEYSRFGTRRECLQKGIGLGHVTEYNSLRQKLKEYGISIPNKYKRQKA